MGLEMCSAIFAELEIELVITFQYTFSIMMHKCNDDIIMSFFGKYYAI